MSERTPFQENTFLQPNLSSRKELGTHDFQTDSGYTFENLVIAYETWGNLNAQADNAILVCHALSGDSHAIGWWESIVGPGKPIDTNRYFVVCSNVLGGCQGTTGPASLHPDGRVFGSRFPKIEVSDMVRAQARLADHLGVAKWKAIIGGSMGGMQALEWSSQFAERVENVVCFASTAAHSAMQIGFNEVARQAIFNDPKYNHGDFDRNDPPVEGLTLARMIGHMTYLSNGAFHEKFGREFQDENGTQFRISSYLNYQGLKFTKRFDAQSLVILSEAIDRFDWRTVSGSKCNYLLISYDKDWLYPPTDSERLQNLLLASNCNCKHHCLASDVGHDAFLLNHLEHGKLLKEIL